MLKNFNTVNRYSNMQRSISIAILLINCGTSMDRFYGSLNILVPNPVREISHVAVEILGLL